MCYRNHCVFFSCFYKYFWLLRSMVLKDLIPWGTGPGPRWANQSLYPELFELKLRKKEFLHCGSHKCKTQKLSAVMHPTMWIQLVCKEREWSWHAESSRGEKQWVLENLKSLVSVVPEAPFSCSPHGSILPLIPRASKSHYLLPVPKPVQKLGFYHLQTKGLTNYNFQNGPLCVCVLNYTKIHLTWNILS